MFKKASLVLLLIMSCFAVSQPDFEDGPYLIYHPDHIEQHMIKGDKKTSQHYAGKLPILREFTIAPHDHYRNVEKIASISDIHGQVEIFKTLLVNNKVIDKNLNWQFGKGHLVITGDIFDRGDTVTEALWLVYKLEQQAQQAGGKVHYLLGNHEYMVLRDDQRYLHKKYLNSLAHYNNDLRVMFSNNTVLGRWLRSKSTIININGFVFLHGGIHQDFLDLKLSLEQANSQFRNTIALSKDELKKNPVYTSLHSRTGPIWYRGYFRDKDLTSKQLDHILSKLNAQHIIVGHTSMETIETRHDKRIIAIDSSIKRGEKGEILLWQNNQFSRGKMNGDTVELW